MLPVVTPAEMSDIDADAPEPKQVLIQRAGYSAANAAIAILGGGYGRRVSIIAGKGNNGEDGRIVAQVLTRREFDAPFAIRAPHFWTNVIL